MAEEVFENVKTEVNTCVCDIEGREILCSRQIGNWVSEALSVLDESIQQFNLLLSLQKGKTDGKITKIIYTTEENKTKEEKDDEEQEEVVDRNKVKNICVKMVVFLKNKNTKKYAEAFSVIKMGVSCSDINKNLPLASTTTYEVSNSLNNTKVNYNLQETSQILKSLIQEYNGIITYVYEGDIVINEEKKRKENIDYCVNPRNNLQSYEIELSVNDKWKWFTSRECKETNDSRFLIHVFPGTIPISIMGF
jgi:hypothetical protein